MPTPSLLEASYTARLATPFAVLGVRTSGGQLESIEYLPKGAATLDPVDRCAERVCRQIGRYLEDPEYPFDLPFAYRGTEFQCRVWREVSSILPGKTNSYKDIAQRLKSAPRPVGGACGANRIPIIIPCHRVLGSNGIGGFMHAKSGFPLDVKRWLLAHEGVTCGR